MADYATTAQIRAFTQVPDSLAGGADGEYWGLLATAASRMFDNLTEVSDSFYGLAGEYANRDFLGDGTAYLRLDPYTFLNETDPVLMNDGTVETPDYEAANVPDYIVRDGSLIVLDRTNQNFTNRTPYLNRFTGWPDGKQIRVSAKWGFTAVPEDITFAVIQIAIMTLRTMDPANAVLANTEKALLVDSLPFMSQEIVKKYKEKYSRKAVF